MSVQPLLVVAAMRHMPFWTMNIPIFGVASVVVLVSSLYQSFLDTHYNSDLSLCMYISWSVASCIHPYLVRVHRSFDCCHVVKTSNRFGLSFHLTCCLYFSWWYCFELLSICWSHQKPPRPSLLSFHVPLEYNRLAWNISHIRAFVPFP